MLQFDVITLFPQLFDEHLNNLPFKRAIANEMLKVNKWNLREFALDSYGTIDGKPYGGGVGMVLMVEPIFRALQSIYKTEESTNPKDTLNNKSAIVLLSPKGERYTQKHARDFAKLEQITLICGRYEGVDARVADCLATHVISIGDYVLSGGELPALTVMESVTRLLPGTLEKDVATEIESFSENLTGKPTIEYPQYTRPEDFNGMKVPEILLSGNHKKIEEWRHSAAGATSSPTTDSTISSGVASGS